MQIGISKSTYQCLVVELGQDVLQVVAVVLVKLIGVVRKGVVQLGASDGVGVESLAQNHLNSVCEGLGGLVLLQVTSLGSDGGVVGGDDIL